MAEHLLQTDLCINLVTGLKLGTLGFQAQVANDKAIYPKREEKKSRKWM